MVGHWQLKPEALGLINISPTFYFPLFCLITSNMSPLMWEDTEQLRCVASKLGPPCGEEDYNVVTDHESTKARL